MNKLKTIKLVTESQVIFKTYPHSFKEYFNQKNSTLYDYAEHNVFYFVEIPTCSENLQQTGNSSSLF